LHRRTETVPLCKQDRADSHEIRRLLTEIADHRGFDLAAIRQSAAQQ